MEITYYKDFSIVEMDGYCKIYSGHRQPRSDTQEAIEGVYQISIKGGVEKAIAYIKERWYGECQTTLIEYCC
ncbi:MAG: hypothetical protein J6Y78_10805 [Paludibacteraceae bacterium]|nr:hypothetical protein [Paludibacteraceae bacterium]